ncbi:YgjP-like metallopeptidase domain-containing protein [Uliginosibacterium sp. H3]|uniref:YgjP-like metallopeptidase domain-containing protein n=1 Tax=Uliginosibacterium silvisoli TaxID=3114758 RepID=A0ABU6K431_9RHOO|nr:YgjP-like metallopeptidase domain-containing protein [Uliginosibacterium sp. H3]
MARKYNPAMSAPPSATRYISGYSPQLIAQTEASIASGQLGPALLKRYPEAHEVRNERALHAYVTDLKNRYQRNAPPLSHISYDNRLHVIRNALGTHTTVSRVQGTKLKSKREIRIASVFRTIPKEFLRMIVVHELAHLREREHDKAFYQLCCHMEPDYHQLEFELRAYLCWLETTGEALWE